MYIEHRAANIPLCPYALPVSADATVEVWEAVPPPPPPSPPPAPANTSTNATNSAGADNATEAGAGAADAADSDAATGDAAAPASAPAEAATADAGTDEHPKLRKRTVKVALNVTGGFVASGMNKSELAASARVLRRLRAADQAKREMAKARNDLEAYIIATRNKVGVRRRVRSRSCEGARAWCLEMPWRAASCRAGAAPRHCCCVRRCTRLSRNALPPASPTRLPTW